jgi:uncharacterized protein
MKLAPGEYRAFEASGSRFLYLVPSAGVVKLDDASTAVLNLLEEAPRGREEVVAALAPRFGDDQVRSSVEELTQIRAVKRAAAPRERMLKVLPPPDFPLTTLVLNVTSKCNLACTYCYEYGEDKIVDPCAEDKPRFMDEETARRSVDFLFQKAGFNEVVHLTFFGGETLLNWKILQKAADYALEKAEQAGKRVAFNLTTNGTLLRDEVIEWMAEYDVTVTISMDGPEESQDKFRVFKNGMGSYAMILPRVKALLARHRSRPIGARVTLTRQNLDVMKIFRHLTEEVGFQEVGFAPVTTADGRDYAIEGEGYDQMLGQFQELAREFLEYASEDRPHGFSNVKETLEEIHKGVSKAYPCGAGLGLMGVATDGEVALCHRFAGSGEHSLGTVQGGIDQGKQQAFLEENHLAGKTDCHTCWARPLCSGGCYHEAHTRYGTTTRPNLHYCEWIRGWTQTCLEVYGALSERNPAWLARLDRMEAQA